MDKKKLLTWGAIGLGVLAVGYVLYRVYQSQQGSTPSPAQLDQYAAAVLPGSGGSAGFDASGVPAGSQPPQITVVPPNATPIGNTQHGNPGLGTSGGLLSGPGPSGSGSSPTGETKWQAFINLNTINPLRTGGANDAPTALPVAYGAGAPVGGQVALNRINSTNFQTARGVPAPAIRFG